MKCSRFTTESGVLLSSMPWTNWEPLSFCQLMDSLMMAPRDCQNMWEWHSATIVL